jgi:hypothetical protein
LLGFDLFLDAHAVRWFGEDAEFADGAPEHLLAAEAEQLEKTLVHVEVAAFGQRADRDRQRAEAEGARETLLTLPQRLLGRAALGHVASDALDLDRAALALDSSGADFQDGQMPLTRLRAKLEFDRAGIFARGVQGQPAVEIRVLPCADEAAEIEALGLFAGDAERAFAGAVEGENLAGEIERVDHVVRILEERAVQILERGLALDLIANLQGLLAHAASQRDRPAEHHQQEHRRAHERHVVKIGHHRGQHRLGFGRRGMNCFA